MNLYNKVMLQLFTHQFFSRQNMVRPFRSQSWLQHKKQLLSTQITKDLYPIQKDSTISMPMKYIHRTNGIQPFRNTFTSSSSYSSKLFVESNSRQSERMSLECCEVYRMELLVPSSDDMEDVGAILSTETKGGDVILLDGDLGAGKTCFSRGFLRCRTGCNELLVTSPTYLLSNTYQANEGNIIIHHMDLYRLSGDREENLDPLNLKHVLANCICLIEWPSRLGSMKPESRLEVTISFDTIDDLDAENIPRLLVLEAHGQSWINKLKMIETEGYLDDLIVEYEEQ